MQCLSHLPQGPFLFVRSCELGSRNKQLETAEDTQSGQSCDREALSPTLVVLGELGPQPELGLNG